MVDVEDANLNTAVVDDEEVSVKKGRYAGRTCGICGSDVAIGLHYGGLICQSCCVSFIAISLGLI